MEKRNFYFKFLTKCIILTVSIILLINDGVFAKAGPEPVKTIKGYSVFGWETDMTGIRNILSDQKYEIESDAGNMITAKFKDQLIHFYFGPSLDLVSNDPSLFVPAFENKLYKVEIPLVNCVQSLKSIQLIKDSVIKSISQKYGSPIRKNFWQSGKTAIQVDYRNHVANCQSINLLYYTVAFKNELFLQKQELANAFWNHLDPDKISFMDIKAGAEWSDVQNILSENNLTFKEEVNNELGLTLISINAGDLLSQNMLGGIKLWVVGLDNTSRLLQPLSGKILQIRVESAYISAAAKTSGAKDFQGIFSKFTDAESPFDKDSSIQMHESRNYMMGWSYIKRDLWLSLTVRAKMINTDLAKVQTLAKKNMINDDPEKVIPSILEWIK